MTTVTGRRLILATAWLFLLAACAPAAQPSPTTAPAKPALSKAEGPAATTAPAKPAEAKPAASPTAVAKPAEAKPAASPVAKPAEAKPAASPAAKPAEAKPAASPASKPAPSTGSGQALSKAEGATVDDKAVADFYRGKTVKIIVGFSPGGGFDTYARGLSRHIGKHIPGTPTVIVENMPGAGSMLAANSVFNAQPKDGTVVVHYIGGIILQQYLGNQGAQFDSSKFQFLGAPTPDSGTCVVRKDAGVTDLAQLRGAQKPLILGGTAPGSNTDDIPNVLKTSLGLNVNLVPGYGGTSDIRLATERGEVQGGCWGWESISVTWKDGLAAGDIIPVGQAGDQPHPDLRNVKMFRDLAQNDEQRQIVKFGIDAPAVFNRPFALAPGVPADRVAALRQAFAATMEDREFRDDAAKANLAIAPISGQRIEQLVQELFAMPADIKTKLQPILLAKP
jgi:tripartite-type tricarboxylate transporter receptor subunit TctC